MGSGISLNTFVDRAKLSDGGDMRMSRDGGELVNKGTLGQKVASFFTDIGKALGLVKETRGNEASDRQEKALAGFREALSQQFTSTVADKVLSEYKGELTGKFVLGAVKSAEGLAKIANFQNARFTAQYELSGESKELGNVAKKLNVDLGKLTDDQRKAFTEHFDRAKEAALKDNLHPLDFGKAQEITEEALRKTMRLPSLRDQRGLDAIKFHVDMIKEAVSNDMKAVGKNPAHLLDLLDQKVRFMVKDTLDLPKGEGPQAFRKVHDQVTSDTQDLLAWAGRSNQKSYVNLSQQTQATVVQYLSDAMHQLLKM
jgi:hypothetical protein